MIFINWSNIKLLKWNPAIENKHYTSNHMKHDTAPPQTYLTEHKENIPFLLLYIFNKINE